MIGKRLAISTFLPNSGFHLPSFNIFKYENHNVDSNHFTTWIDRTSSMIRKELGKIIQSVYLPQSMHLFVGKDAKVTLTLDNATWHN